MDEFKALKYIHHCIYHDNKQPTVRGIAQALERRSSRSGFRALNLLMKRGLVYRDENGYICMREDVTDCSAKLVIIDKEASG
jgi:predicted transcriptional regulator